MTRIPAILKRNRRRISRAAWIAKAAPVTPPDLSGPESSSFEKLLEAYGPGVVGIRRDLRTSIGNALL